MKFDQWRISFAMIGVLVSMLGLVVSLHGIVTGQQVAFYVGTGALFGGLITAMVLLEKIRNRRN
ncbi:DUF2964 family protein [Paraburkholderia rhizosphaerae]|uniref:DUF2964 family protein n=1 Tax=Paraburkholderia rhizosphaerae TaxID=480658 RepID=A0A4R8LVW0_9BURK|nr:DUF2964 family protein [Paraburkholderia rhizosphaerae]TDY50927.1 Protein of unknown function (DUF2964) [Paraburkholderia rhizosphaerae]